MGRYGQSGVYLISTWAYQSQISIFGFKGIGVLESVCVEPLAATLQACGLCFDVNHVDAPDSLSIKHDKTP